MSGAARCVIITGLSGAGRSSALRILEDRGFYAVDNLPPMMLPSLVEALSANDAAATWGIAAVVSALGENTAESIANAITAVEEGGTRTQLVFFDASDEVLVRRYETTRRRHPLGEGITTMDGIKRERAETASLKDMANTVVDTSSMSAEELRTAIMTELEMNEYPFTVIVSSFGFKNGIPRDCDYLFDMRFLPNPNYVPELKRLSGRDIEVQSYLDKISEKQVFMKHLVSLMEFILKHYENTGKKQLHVAIGCTGGRHRSVAIVEQLSKLISDTGHRTATNHRDIDLESN
ncbi:MAG: RNase adapter RapZ [Synergistaceae bacterium]|nr:RNase adapter RapZ [Synergistaceae bacterium]